MTSGRIAARTHLACASLALGPRPLRTRLESGEGTVAHLSGLLITRDPLGIELPAARLPAAVLCRSRVGLPACRGARCAAPGDESGCGAAQERRAGIDLWPELPPSNGVCDPTIQLTYGALHALLACFGGDRSHHAHQRYQIDTRARYDGGTCSPARQRMWPRGRRVQNSPV